MMMSFAMINFRNAFNLVSRQAVYLVFLSQNSSGWGGGGGGGGGGSLLLPWAVPFLMPAVLPT